MKILVTGSNGFIGKNLVMKLKEMKELTVFECDKETDRHTLEEYCREADFVYHLAGINRTNQEEDFMRINYGFTKEILDFICKYHKACPFLLTSSIQADYNNAYGKSKKAAEDLVISYAGEQGADVFIYRLPNIFGKWCKPNYNSVVATFCHHITRNLPITIDDPGKVLNLVYIDDLVNEFIRLLYLGTKEKELKDKEQDVYYEIHPIHTVSLERIANLLYSFQEGNRMCYLPDLEDEFSKKLYSTYLSYLPEEKLSYKLTMHCDDRGSFTEFLKTIGNGQISVNVIKPGIIKGNHYHHTKVEKFLVVSGKGIIRLKHVISGLIREIYVSSDTLEVVEIPAGYAHNIENLGNCDMVVLIWCNEVFDKDNPDTYLYSI